MSQILSNLVDATQLVSDFLWTYVVIVILVFCALYFSWRGRGLQFLLLRDMWREVINKPVTRGSSAPDQHETTEDAGVKKIGSFHAFALLRNYLEQKRQGQEPQFRRHMMPKDEADIECWD